MHTDMHTDMHTPYRYTRHAHALAMHMHMPYTRHAHALRTPCMHMHMYMCMCMCLHMCMYMSRVQAEALRAFSEGRANHVDSVSGQLCGTPCQDLVDSAGTAVCASTWREGCGEDEPPPAGFSADANVAKLCSLSCAWYVFQSTPVV